MASKEEIAEKERRRALSKQFIDECKMDMPNRDLLDYLLSEGADIAFNASRAMLVAVKKHDFELVNYLIDKGALYDFNARSHIANTVNFKGCDEQVEENFFQAVDKAISLTGDKMTYLIPYINTMAVTNSLEKLERLMQKYNLTARETAEKVNICLIFEIIKDDKYDVLDFINENTDWLGQDALNLAVSLGEVKATEYILEAGGYCGVASHAALKAVFCNFTGVLDALMNYGFDFENYHPAYLLKAAEACSVRGTAPLEYLLKHGYTLTPVLRGKVTDYARKTDCAVLIKFLTEYDQ